MNDGRLTPELLNQGFFEAEQYINPVIMDRSKNYISLWRDKIARGVFTLGEGYVKKARKFYGGLAIQDSERTWKVMQPSRAPDPDTGDPGHDACRYTAPVVGYGLEEEQYSIYETTRRTLDICLTDILFKWQFTQQLQMMFGMLTNITLGEWENWLRERYLGFCTKILANPAMQEVAMDLGADTIAIPPGVDINDIGQLNQALLDRLYMYLSRQCALAAIGRGVNGMPAFGLVTSYETSNEIITRDPVAVENFRYARPEVLIEGFGQALNYKGFAHIHDMQTVRYAIDPTDPANLIRVWPHRQVPTTIGESVSIDPAYIDAPFEVSVVFLKDVFKALVPAGNPTNIGGHEFGPQDNLGEFRWLNIQDRENNLLREKGFYFARFRAAPAPGQFSDDAVAILHRRCTDVPVILCNTAETSTDGCEELLSIADWDADVDTNTKIEVILGASLLGIGIGSTIYITVDQTTITGIVTDDSGDGQYVIDLGGTGPDSEHDDGWAAFIAAGTTVEFCNSDR